MHPAADRAAPGQPDRHGDGGDPADRGPAGAARTQARRVGRGDRSGHVSEAHRHGRRAGDGAGLIVRTTSHRSPIFPDRFQRITLSMIL